MACFDVTVCLWNSLAISALNTRFYLFRSVAAKQSGPKHGLLQNLGTDAGTCVYYTGCLSVTAATWSITSYGPIYKEMQDLSEDSCKFDCGLSLQRSTIAEKYRVWLG